MPLRINYTIFSLLVLCVMMADKYLSDDPRPMRIYS